MKKTFKKVDGLRVKMLLLRFLNFYPPKPLKCRL